MKKVFILLKKVSEESYEYLDAVDSSEEALKRVLEAQEKGFKVKVEEKEFLESTPSVCPYIPFPVFYHYPYSVSPSYDKFIITCDGTHEGTNIASVSSVSLEGVQSYSCTAAKVEPGSVFFTQGLNKEE